MTSSRLIGRAAELAELEAALRDAADGRPSLAFVAGESGVGKSRLVAELAGRAGARVAIGECVELGEEELPYAPIVSVLRTLARDDDPVLGELPDSVRAELATLLPELGGEARNGGGGTHGQPQLFEALLTLLDQLGREQPFALVLEDIHWADRSTRAFLVFLARSLWTERVLVIATYRSDELHRRHPLRPLLAELERDTRSRRIELARLSREELGDLLTDILGGAADAELLERLYTRSEGNPLFTEELLAARLDGRGGLPSTLRDALMVRIERLSQPAQEVLRVLSAGRVLAHAVLAEASGLDAAEVRAALREAAESNVIVADQRGRYQFRHALLREVVHDDLLPGEHSELHLALARALEHQAAETRRGRADHRRHRAPLPAGRRAARGARGLRPRRRRRRARARPRRGGRAARARARAVAAGARRRRRRRAATATACCAARAARSSTTAPTGARRRCCGSRSTTSTTTPSRAGRPTCSSCCRARSGRSGAPPTRASRSTARSSCCRRTTAAPERARILARQAKTAMLQGRFSEALPAAEAAFGAAKHANADGPLADALNAMGHSQILLGEVEDGSARLREAIAISPRGFERTSAWTNLADALHIVGRSQEGLAAAEQGLADTAFEGRVSDWLSLTLVDIRWALGDWGAARAGLPPPDKRHIGMTLAYVETLRAAIALADAEHDAVRESLGRVVDVVTGSREPQFLGWYGSLLGELERRCGDLAAARAAIDDGLDAIEFCSEDLPRIALLSETGAAIEADAAQRARDLGDDDAEREAISRAESFVMRAEACADDVRPVEIARHATARGAPRPRSRRRRPGARRRRGRRLARGRAALPGGARAAAPGRDAGRARRPRRRRGPARRRARRRRHARRAVAARRGRGPGRARAAGARHRRRGAAVGDGRRGPVRPHAARAPGARAAGRRRDEPRDRRAAVHGREDRERARLPHPRQARRPQPHRGGGGRASLRLRRLRP